MYTVIRQNKKFAILLLVNVICLGIVFFYSSKLSAKKVIKAEHANIHFDHRSPDPALSNIKEFKVDGKSEAKRISINFEMKALDDNYDNVFQTASDPYTLRFELTHPNTATLITGSDKSDVTIYKITDKFALNVWHKVNINVSEDKKIDVDIDGQKMLSVTDKAITYNISDMAVGTGYNKLRGFQGEIKNFHIKYERYERIFVFELIIFLTNILLFITALVFAYKLLASSYGVPLHFDGPGVSEVLFIPGLAIIIVLVGHFIGVVLHSTSHWIPFLFLGFVAPFFHYFYTKLYGSSAPANIAKLAGSIAALSFLASIAFFIFASLPVLAKTKPIIVFLCIWISILYTLAFSGYLPMSLAEGKKRLFFTLTLITFSLASWFAMLDLPNWRQFYQSLAERPVVTCVIFFFFTGVIHRYLFKLPDTPLPLTFSTIYAKLSWPIRILLITPVLVIFALMSFRHDTLFLGTSEAHWEYFIGPIRNLKNGSWLLWDTPSQYGFLNLFTASLLPFKSTWESFYVLQAILLCFVSVMVFKTTLAGRSLRSSIFFGFTVTFSGLFFSDPDLIGPYLYPSSSVMRFFWCYVLLFFLLKFSLRSHISLMRLVCLGTVLWLTGFWWSSESAIYSSVTFFPAIFTAILQNYYEKLKDSEKTVPFLKHILLYMSIPTFSFAAVICAITAYYRIRLSHFPDFYAFVEHGFAYTGGFGFIDLNPAGPVWMLFLLFCAILLITVKMVLKDLFSRHLVPLVGAAGCLWGISSYFMGRAVANNVTAILPILGFIAIVVLNSAETRGLNSSHIIFKAITAPLFTIILVTSFGNMEFVDKLRNFQSLTVDVSQKVRAADPLLQELIVEAKIKPSDPIVYYGHAAAMPRWKNNAELVISEKTWLPNPLQLLEEPIKDERRTLYLHRFMDRSRQGGYFVQAKGEAEDRVAKWHALITRTHSTSRIYENSKWKITYYERLKSS